MLQWGATTLAVGALLWLTACTTGLHAGFVPHTYIAANAEKRVLARGPAIGKSCQTKVLYVFPRGEAPSTEEALQIAMNRHPGTEYLANMSVEDGTEWGFLYSRQCIIVSGTAY